MRLEIRSASLGLGSLGRKCVRISVTVWQRLKMIVPNEGNNRCLGISFSYLVILFIFGKLVNYFSAFPLSEAQRRFVSIYHITGLSTSPLVDYFHLFNFLFPRLAFCRRLMRNNGI